MAKPTEDEQELARQQFTRNASKLLESYDSVGRAADAVARNLLLANAGGIAATLAIFGSVVSSGKPVVGVFGPLWCFVLGLILAGFDGYRNFAHAKRHQIYNRLEMVRAAKVLGEKTDYDEIELEKMHLGLKKFSRATKHIKIVSALFFCIGAVLGLINLSGA